MIIRDAIPSDATFLAKCVMAGMHFYGFESDIPENIEIYRRLTKNVSVNISLTERIPMIEHFSASTCVPCVNVNNLMLQLTQNNPGKFTYTKYPEQFPGSGDPYYYSEVGV